MTRTSEFVWTDKDNKQHKLSEIDDTYLNNIIRYLERKLIEIPLISEEYLGDDLWVSSDNEGLIYEYTELIEFLKRERRKRASRVQSSSKGDLK